MFAGGATGPNGWVGLTITYPRPLSAPIADAKIIDVRVEPECAALLRVRARRSGLSLPL